MTMKKLVTMVTTVNVKFTTENLVQVHSVCFNFVVALFGLFVSFVFLTYRPRLPLFCDFTPTKNIIPRVTHRPPLCVFIVLCREDKLLPRKVREAVLIK